MGLKDKLSLEIIKVVTSDDSEYILDMRISGAYKHIGQPSLIKEGKKDKEIFRYDGSLYMSSDILPQFGQVMLYNQVTEPKRVPIQSEDGVHKRTLKPEELRSYFRTSQVISMTVLQGEEKKQMEAELDGIYKTLFSEDIRKEVTEATR